MPKLTHRIKAGEVRMALFEIVQKTLRGEGEFGGDIDFKKQLILRIASNLLPRLNEHTGEDGGAMVVVTSPELAEKYGLSTITSSTSDDSE